MLGSQPNTKTHSAKTLPSKSSTGKRVAGLKHPITASGNDASDPQESSNGDRSRPTPNKERTVQRLMEQIKRFLHIPGKKTRSPKPRLEKKEPLFVRLKNIFNRDKEKDWGLKKKDRSVGGEEDTQCSSSQNIGPINEDISQKQIQDTSWSQSRTVNHLHPPGDPRLSSSSIELPDVTLRPVRSSSRGSGDFRKEMALKNQIDAGASLWRATRPTDVGKGDVLPAINVTAESSEEMLEPEQRFLKEYAEGKFPAENPFVDNPNFTFLTAPHPPNEAARLAKLATYNLKKADDTNFKRIVALTQNIFQTKSAVISVLQKNDQLFKARIGYDHISKMPRNVSLCAHAILEQDAEPLVIPDTANDWRFARNPSVVGEPSLRFYAAAPLRTEDGFNLGTLSISDPVPRDLSPNDRRIMMELAALATREFDQLEHKSGSRNCHINQMVVSQFVQQAPYYKNMEDIFDCVCRSLSKTLKTDIHFVLEVTCLAEKKFLARAAHGIGELSRHGKNHDSAFESQEWVSSISDGEGDAFGDIKDGNTSTSHSRGRSFSDKKPRGLGPETRDTRRPSFREMGRHGSTRTIRLLEDIVDRILQPAMTEVPHNEKDESLEILSHRQLADLLFPQTRGFCCCTVPSENVNGRLGTASLFDFQKFCPVGGAEKFSVPDETQNVMLEGEVIASSDSGSMYIIGAFTKDPTVPLTDCQLTCMLSFATALSSAVSHHKSEVALRKSEADVRKEKELLTALVNNILPPVYAERLKNDQCAVADRFSNCSILFADIVGFTSIGGKMAADELVGMLNKIFIRFDMIAEDLCVEKIKTIGDCYMAATGVPVEQDNHAEVMAEFALALLAAVQSFNKTSETPIQIRIGINSGPVVAGAIGHSKFVYDLWGNAVNIAQRMEAGSDAGRINVSQDTYLLLRNEYRFTPRGSYPVKGAGQMEMYFLQGRCQETRDEEGLLPEDALVRDIEAAMVNHTVFGKLNAFQNLSGVGQQSSTANSGSVGLAALMGSLCELSPGGSNLDTRRCSFNGRCF